MPFYDCRTNSGAFNAYQTGYCSFNACQSVENNWNRFISKRPLFRTRSVRIKNFLARKCNCFLLDLSVLFLAWIKGCVNFYVMVQVCKILVSTSWIVWCYGSLLKTIIPFKFNSPLMISHCARLYFARSGCRSSYVLPIQGTARMLERYQSKTI